MKMFHFLCAQSIRTGKAVRDGGGTIREGGVLTTLDKDFKSYERLNIF